MTRKAEDRAAKAETIVVEEGDVSSPFRIRIEITLQPENMPPAFTDANPFAAMDHRNKRTRSLRKVLAPAVQRAWEATQEWAQRVSPGSGPPPRVPDPPNTSPRPSEVTTGVGSGGYP